MPDKMTMVFDVVAHPISPLKFFLMLPRLICEMYHNIPASECKEAGDESMDD
jgi:hypothetical protein